MAYEKVSKDNVTYQPRLNIIQLLRDNLTNSKLDIYANVPDTTARDFKGFPFLIIPDIPLTPIEDTTLRGNVQYGFELSCEIRHDRAKMGDNQVRTIRQDLVKMFNLRDNKRILNKYGVYVNEITFEASEIQPTMEDGKDVIILPFSLSIGLDINMGA
jgi:hypothetical protein